MISMIAAVGRHNELGKDNNLIFHIKEDMRFFKATTLGHPVIMGLNTFESISKPLPGRENYIASRSSEPTPTGTTKIPDLITFLDAHRDDPKEYFIIGGATIYRLALPYATTLYLTEIDATREADAFFPDFDKSKYSRTVIKKGKDYDLEYSFVKYTKK